MVITMYFLHVFLSPIQQRHPVQVKDILGKIKIKHNLTWLRGPFERHQRITRRYYEKFSRYLQTGDKVNQRELEEKILWNLFKGASNRCQGEAQQWNGKYVYIIKCTYILQSAYHKKYILQSVYHTKCMLYKVYIIKNVCYTKCILYKMYIIQTVYFRV